MDESKKLNAVIDVIMLAGTILLRNGSEIYRVEDTMVTRFMRELFALWIVMFWPCLQLFFSPLKIQISLE